MGKESHGFQGLAGKAEDKGSLRVCLGCHSEVPLNGGLEQQKFISHSSSVQKSEIKVPVGLVSE